MTFFDSVRSGLAAAGVKAVMPNVCASLNITECSQAALAQVFSIRMKTELMMMDAKTYGDDMVNTLCPIFTRTATADGSVEKTVTTDGEVLNCPAAATPTVKAPCIAVAPAACGGLTVAPTNLNLRALSGTMDALYVEGSGHGSLAKTDFCSVDAAPAVAVTAGRVAGTCTVQAKIKYIQDAATGLKAIGTAAAGGTGLGGSVTAKDCGTAATDLCVAAGTKALAAGLCGSKIVDSCGSSCSIKSITVKLEPTLGADCGSGTTTAANDCCVTVVKDGTFAGTADYFLMTGGVGKCPAAATTYSTWADLKASTDACVSTDIVTQIDTVMGVDTAGKCVDVATLGHACS